MSAYQLVIFDFDGTLCYSKTAVNESVQAAYRYLGKPAPDLKDIEDVLAQGVKMEDMLRKFSPEADKRTIQQLLSQYVNIYLVEGEMHSYLFSGVKSLLAQLKAALVDVAIVSNKLQVPLDSALSRFEIVNYVKVAVGIQENGLRKPDPRVYETAIHPLFPTIKREQILMVGDTVVDLQFAQALSVDACWVSYGHGSPTICEVYRPRYVIDQVVELNAILL